MLGTAIEWLQPTAIVVRVMQMDKGVHRLSKQSKHRFTLSRDLQQHTNFGGSTIAHHHTKHIQCVP